MKTLVRFGLALTMVMAAFSIVGCTDESTRAVLTVVEVNEGNAYFSDLINEKDTLNVFIPVDAVPVTFGNIPNDGGAPLAPGSPFSEIVVTGYTVTYANGIYMPVSGGMNVRVPSGGTAGGSIVLSNPSEKGALLGSLGGTVTTTAHITFTGYNRINGASNGDHVTARANLTVQVGNFGDDDTN